MLVIAYLTLIAFVQLGVSYWLSVGVFGCLGIFFVRKRNIALLFDRHLALRGLTAILMPFAVAVSPDAEIGDVLFACREGLFLFLLTGAFSWSWPASQEPRRTNIATKILMFAIAMLILVVLQSISLRTGRYLGVPAGWYASNQITIPTEQALGLGFSRPNGTYGEPSYLGGVCLTLIFALSPLILSSRSATRAAAVLFITTVLSTSLSGVLSIFAYCSQLAWRRVRSSAALFILFVALLLIVLVLLLTENSISERLSNISSGHDVSAWTRIFAPLMLIPDVFSHSVLGYPKSVFTDLGYINSIGVKADELGHNALLNLLIGYGVVGFLALFTLFRCAKTANKKLFVFLIACQNGALLAPDKFAMLSFSFMVYNSLARQQAQRSLRGERQHGISGQLAARNV